MECFHSRSKPERCSRDAAMSSHTQLHGSDFSWNDAVEEMERSDRRAAFTPLQLPNVWPLSHPKQCSTLKRHKCRAPSRQWPAFILGAISRFTFHRNLVEAGRCPRPIEQHGHAGHRSRADQPDAVLSCRHAAARALTAGIRPACRVNNVLNVLPCVPPAVFSKFPNGAPVSDPACAL